MNKSRRTLAFAATLSLATLVHSNAQAQSTAFTYQGFLDDAGSPANGLHDFRFRLFSVASGGVPIGSTLCADNVDVIEGVFTAQIDFGQQFATTAQRHLEIEVRRDTGLTCGNVAGFVVMAPRQQLTATPMASHAKSAFALDAADGSPASAVFVDNSGNVGIGTTSPAAKLHVKGAAEGLRVEGEAPGAANSAWVGFQDSNGTRIGYVGDGSGGDNSVYLASDAGDVHIYTSVGAAVSAKSNGNVGVGTTTPAAKLDVRGNIRLGPSGQFQAAAGDENLRLLRGEVDGNGTIVSGTGFNVQRTGEGTYTLTFSTPFSGVPTLVPFVDKSAGSQPRFLTVNTLTASVAGILIEFDGSENTDSDWSFCAIGPR